MFIKYNVESWFIVIQTVPQVILPAVYTFFKKLNEFKVNISTSSFYRHRLLPMYTNIINSK